MSRRVEEWVNDMRGKGQVISLEKLRLAMADAWLPSKES